MIDTIVLYILILTKLTLILNQRHRSARKHKFGANYLIKFSMYLNGMEPHTRFILFIQYSRERTLYDYIILLEKNFNVGLYSDIYRQISFEFSVMIKTTKLYILISVWMTLTFIQSFNVTVV